MEHIATMTAIASFAHFLKSKMLKTLFELSVALIKVRERERETHRERERGTERKRELYCQC